MNTYLLRPLLSIATALMVLLLLAHPPHELQAQTPDGKSLVRMALDAMGGEAKWHSFGRVYLDGTFHQYQVDQAEAPDGLPPILYFDFKEIHDWQHERLRYEATLAFGSRQFTRVWLYDDGVVALSMMGQLQPDQPGYEERLYLSPEGVLFSALAAEDVTVGPDRIDAGVAYWQIQFTWQEIPIRLGLHKQTYLPAYVDRTRPVVQDYFNVLGDVTTRTRYTRWAVYQSGLVYPQQWQVAHNGAVTQLIQVENVTVVPEAPADSLVAIPNEVKTAYRTRQQNPPSVTFDDVVEVSEGIVYLVSDQHINATLIRQDDGVVVLEAPISPDFSAAVLAEAEQRFPGVPVKAVVISSPTWIYVGGMRTYVARGIPIYVLPAHQPMLAQMAQAPFISKPDALAHQPRPADFRLVTAPVMLGHGANRMVLAQAHTEAPRLRAYFPEHRLFYAGDLFVGRPPAQMMERFGRIQHSLVAWHATVDVDSLAVDRGFTLHSPPFAWDTFTQDVAAVTER